MKYTQIRRIVNGKPTGKPVGIREDVAKHWIAKGTAVKAEAVAAVSRKKQE